ncbi:MAG TPA: cation:proton antiporter [Longimicrobiales bacterium]|nr:cation:proton antiporter [Longimicrobiales bacterium]
MNTRGARTPRAFIRPTAAYVLLVGVPVAVLLLVLSHGPTTVPARVDHGLSPTPQRGVALPDLANLIIQVVLILVAARVVGYAFRKARQPQVVGEMAAGILLGPSVFGTLLPGAFATVFPVSSLGYLQTLSQMGLLLFMFVIGLEFDPNLLRGRGHTAVITSHASITLPFLLGSLVAVPLYPRLAPAGVAFTPFALFMGAAMSVTAFPVLARILAERGLTHSRVGVVALACAAVDDVTAWCMLALVVMVVRSSSADQSLWTALAGTAGFVLTMLLLIRPLIERVAQRLRGRVRGTQDATAALLIFAFASALITERIGIHALFGAFLAGVVIPRDETFVRELIHRLEELTLVFLLPLFFAFTGLRTVITSVGPGLWTLAATVIAAAIIGKFGGSALAARATGMNWTEAGTVGALMNTRGLMELVILNVGLDIGVVSPPLFAIMVLMALITTGMTSPLLDLLQRERRGPRTSASAGERFADAGIDRKHGTGGP